MIMQFIANANRMCASLLAAAALCASAILTGPCHADILEGPYVALPLTDMAHSGLQFTALQDVTMTNFVFYNQGRQDTILFIDAETNNIIESLPTTPGYTEHFFRVDWELTAGRTYWLTSVLHNNVRYTEYSNFPLANDDLRVDGVIDGQRNLRTDIWVSFRFLTTVPAPGALMLFAGAGLLARRGRRRVSRD
jgi:hypothetical protein